MTSLTDIPVTEIFKGIILDSFMGDGFINPPQPPPTQENVREKAKKFFFKHKKTLITSTALVAGFALGPVIVGGVIGALGFGEAGIAAGSIAAWLMSLHRGAVAAGSLVAILQSIGAAGLGIGGVIAAGLGGGIFTGVITKALLNILESNPEGLTELEKYVTIIETTAAEKSIVIFEMKPQLLTSDEKLKSFFKGFDLAQKFAGEETRRFEFVVGNNEPYIINLRRNLEDTYGSDNVSSATGSLFLKLND